MARLPEAGTRQQLVRIAVWLLAGSPRRGFYTPRCNVFVYVGLSASEELFEKRKQTPHCWGAGGPMRTTLAPVDAEMKRPCQSPRQGLFEGGDPPIDARVPTEEHYVPRNIARWLRVIVAVVLIYASASSVSQTSAPGDRTSSAAQPVPSPCITSAEKVATCGKVLWFALGNALWN